MSGISILFVKPSSQSRGTSGPLLDVMERSTSTEDHGCSIGYNIDPLSFFFVEAVPALSSYTAGVCVLSTGAVSAL